MLRVHLVTAVAQVVPAFALRALLPWGEALLLTLALYLCTMGRLRLLVEDRKRPRWLVRWVDEPLFWHWGACFYGLLLFAPAVAAVALADRVNPAWSAALFGDWPMSVSNAALVAYLLASPVAAWSVWGIRRRLRVRACEIPIAGLSSELDGYRIVQLSDLHIGGFDPEARGRDWAARANALDPDLCVVTGDLVTSGAAFYEDAAGVVGRLQARDGVFVSMGNHDQWDNEELTAQLVRRGACVLRNEFRCVRRGTAQLIVAGLDDHYTEKDDLDATLVGRPPGVPTLLLAHDPARGGEAAERGVELVLSGHTHGGQIGLPFVGDRVNLNLVTGQPRSGLHERRGRWQYISAGLGTTGPPLRLGIAPEIALLVLRARAGNMSAR